MTDDELVTEEGPDESRSIHLRCTTVSGRAMPAWRAAPSLRQLPAGAASGSASVALPRYYY